MKRFFSFVILLLGIATLTGCMRMHADLTLSEDGNVSGTVKMALDEQWAASQGLDTSTLADEMKQDLDASPDSGVSVKPYKDGDYRGVELTLTKTPLDKISAASGGALRVTNVGGKIQVDGDPSQFPPVASVKNQKAWKVDLSITFPHGVKDSNGTVSGSTVTWHLTPDSGAFHASGPAKAGGIGVGAVTAIVVGSLGVLAVVVWMYFRYTAHGQSARKRFAATRDDSASGLSQLDEGNTESSGSGEDE